MIGVLGLVSELVGFIDLIYKLLSIWMSFIFTFDDDDLNDLVVKGVKGFLCFLFDGFRECDLIGWCLNYNV